MDALLDIDALVRILHSTPRARERWRDFVQAIVTTGGASYVNFMVCRPRDQAHGFEYIAGGSPFPKARETYADRFAQIDPIPYFSMQPGTIMDLASIYNDTDYDDDLFFTAYLKPSGLARMLIVRCTEPSGFSGWLTLGRSEAEPAFEPGMIDALRTLAAHIPIALENWADAEKLRIERDVYAGVAKSMRISAMLLDDEGRLLDPDMCQNASEIRGLQIDLALRLHATSPALETQLQAHVGRLCGGEGPDTVAMRLSSAPPCDLLLARLPTSDRLFRGRVPRIAVLVRDGAGAIDHGSIARLFNLSPREAQLTAKLVDGLRVADASRALGLTEETGRTYAKRVLSKTGLSTQSDLVRSILTSSAPLSGVTMR